MEKSSGIHACLWPSDSKGVTIKPSIMCLLFCPSDLVRIVVKHDSIDEGEVI